MLPLSCESAADLSMTEAPYYDQLQLQTVLDKINELITALRWMVEENRRFTSTGGSGCRSTCT